MRITTLIIILFPLFLNAEKFDYNDFLVKKAGKSYTCSVIKASKNHIKLKTKFQKDILITYNSIMDLTINEYEKVIENGNFLIHKFALIDFIDKRNIDRKYDIKMKKFQKIKKEKYMGTFFHFSYRTLGGSIDLIKPHFDPYYIPKISDSIENTALNFNIGFLNEREIFYHTCFTFGFQISYIKQLNLDLIYDTYSYSDGYHTEIYSHQINDLKFFYPSAGLKYYVKNFNKSFFIDFKCGMTYSVLGDQKLVFENLESGDEYEKKISLSTKETLFNYSIGIGWKLKKIMLELSYTPQLFFYKYEQSSPYYVQGEIFTASVGSINLNFYYFING